MNREQLPDASARVKKKNYFQPIWLVPIVIALVVGYVIYDNVLHSGKTIMITFNSAEGLLPGETALKHKNVQLGTVEDVRLTDDLSHVEVKLRVKRHEAAILTDHARFWVVRPRLQGGLIAGVQASLETLTSGAYIAVDPGQPGGARQDRFTGLEEPPGVRSDEPGKVVVLKSEKLGALGPGAPVYYREVTVGEVLKYEVGNPGDPIKFRTFIRAPYDRLVNDKTRFWNVSGLNVGMGPEGLHVELASVQALLSGGVSFDTPKGQEGPPVADSSEFGLYDSKARADANKYAMNVPCVTYLETSINGLAEGAPVQLLGATIGQVDEIRFVNHPKKPGAWLVRVSFDIQPERIPAIPGTTPMTLQMLQQRPPHVVLDSTNILLSQKVLTLDFSDARTKLTSADVWMEGELLVLPGEGGGMDNVSVALGHIAGKLEKIPFDDIGKNLNETLASVSNTVGGQDMQNAIKKLSATMEDVRKLVANADKNLGPTLERLPQIADQLQQAIAGANTALGGGAGYGADSDFQRNIQRLMTQVSEAARSFRLLADFLDRHPEALLRGRNGATEK